MPLFSRGGGGLRPYWTGHSEKNFFCSFPKKVDEMNIYIEGIYPRRKISRMGPTHRQSRVGEGLTRAFGVMSDMSVVKHNDWSAALKTYNQRTRYCKIWLWKI